MSITDFTQLRCWQLADEVRRQVIAICARETAHYDLRFCNSFRSAAGSVCRNLAEGFRRFDSPQIVQFFEYALSSLAEVQDHLHESRERGVITGPEFERMHDVTEHTKAMAIKFMKPHVLKTRATAGKSRRRRTQRT